MNIEKAKNYYSLSRKEWMEWRLEHFGRILRFILTGWVDYPSDEKSRERREYMSQGRNKLKRMIKHSNDPTTATDTDIASNVV